MAALAGERGDVHHELRAQAAIGEAQVALLGAHLIDGDAGGRSAGRLGTGRLWQQQLLHVGDPSFAYLDAGEGLAQQDIGDPDLLADAVIAQAAQLQALYLQQSLVVGPVQHLQLVDVEAARDLQLAQCPLRIGRDGQLGAAAEQTILHLDPQQILQIGLGPAQRQPLLLDLAVKREGGEAEGTVEVQLALAVEGAGEGQRRGLVGGAAQGAQIEVQPGERARQRLAAARLGQLELALADAGLLELPAPGLARLLRFGRRFGGGWRDEQLGQIQPLSVIEHGRHGRGLERDGVDIEGLLAAIEPDPGQGQLVEAGKFGPLGPPELPVVQDQLALRQPPIQPLLALAQPVVQLGAGIPLGQIDLEVGGPERREGGERQLAEAESPLAGPGQEIELPLGLERALLIEGRTQPVAIGRCLGRGEVGQLQRHGLKIERWHPARAALLAAIPILDLALFQGQPVDAHQHRLGGGGGLSRIGGQHPGQRLGQIEARLALALVIGEADQIQGRFGQDGIGQDDGFLLPALARQRD
ncbi:hypothetical protein D3C84_228230 [compost metagenome]